MMLKLKAQLKTAPSTHDEDYELKKSTLKDLGKAVRSYKAAMGKVRDATKALVDAFVNLQKSLEGMTGDAETPENVRDVALAYSASTNRVCSDFFVEYQKKMDESVLPAVEQVRQMYQECTKLEKSRNSVMNEYDAYRNVVQKKEEEYTKKGKDLGQSKSYGSEVSKRDALNAKFTEADQKFKDYHSYLMASKVSTTAQCMNDFITCTYNFTEGLAREFEGLSSASRQAVSSLDLNAANTYDQ